jgi:hypothetical protein
MIIDALNIQSLLTVCDWFMENVSNPTFDWTMHPSSSIPPTIVEKSTVPTTSSSTTATNTIVHTIPAEPTSSTTNHTTTLVLPTLLLSIRMFSNISITFCTITNIHYIITNHQIIPTQQICLDLEYTIFVANTYKLFDPGGIISSKSQ